MRVGIRCPHCGHRATARTSAAITRLYREITYRCENDRCGHVYVASLEVRRTLSPSAIPNPAVQIELSRHVRRRELTEQINPRHDQLTLNF